MNDNTHTNKPYSDPKVASLHQRIKTARAIYTMKYGRI